MVQPVPAPLQPLDTPPCSPTFLEVPLTPPPPPPGFFGPWVPMPPPPPPHFFGPPLVWTPMPPGPYDLGAAYAAGLWVPVDPTFYWLPPYPPPPPPFFASPTSYPMAPTDSSMSISTSTSSSALTDVAVDSSLVLVVGPTDTAPVA